MVDTDLHYGQGYPSYQPPKRSRTTAYVVLAVLVVAAAIIIVLLIMHRRHNSPAQPQTHTPKPTHQQTPVSPSSTPSPNHATTKTENSDFSNVLENDDNPTGVKYQVTSGTEPVAGWFIVHVTATNGYGTFQQIAVLKQAADGSTDAVAGPDTSFPKSYLESENVPNAVINQLPTYNE